MKKGKLIIYWDYELQKGPDMSSNVIYHNKKPEQDGIEDYHQTEFILKHLKNKGIPNCFAVLGYAAKKGKLPYHSPEQIKTMVEEGHEVGSHSHLHKEVSSMTYDEFVKDLKESKRIIEKVTKQKCISFVPPRNKPIYFCGLPLDLDLKSKSYKLSKLSFKDIRKALYEAGFKTYRIYSPSIFSKIKLSKTFIKNNILTIPFTIPGGFDLRAKQLVKKAIDNRGLAVVYGHPKSLNQEGLQNKKFFVDFINYINKQKENGKLEVILPRDLIKNEL